jgi:trans-aconitate 2-methyltransferase
LQPYDAPVTTTWDPEQYLKYGDERGRPFVELVSRIFHPAPKKVIDLGCGPGTTTALLMERWPSAHITGLDSSEEMIERAGRVAVPGKLEFRVGDLSDLDWTAEGPFDVVLCAATFQWVPGHADLFPQIVEALTETGVFAFQVPANFDQPSHTLLYEFARSDRWSHLLGNLVRPDPVLPASGYLKTLLDTGVAADVWSTTYLHVLQGPDAVLEWVRGTALRPFLGALQDEGPAEAVQEFEASYGAALRAAYPMDGQGRTIFPFRRIFAVTSPSSEND